MKKRSVLLFLVLAALLVCLPLSAKASTVSYNFSATGFSALYGGDSPITTMTGLLTLTYDGTDVTGVSLTVDQLGFASTSVLGFNQVKYSYWFGAYSYLRIGYITDTGDTVDGLNSGSTDISLSLCITDSEIGSLSKYYNTALVYTNSSGGYWMSGSVTLTEATPVAVRKAGPRPSLPFVFPAQRDCLAVARG